MSSNPATWPTTPPSEPGWYWRHYDDGQGDVRTEVAEAGDSEFWRAMGKPQLETYLWHSDKMAEGMQPVTMAHFRWHPQRIEQP